ncbi:hypothetical protein GCM10009616_18310 [Microlunatus lacustris]
MTLESIETPAADPAARYDGLPPTWSSSAKETYAQVEEDNPELTSAALSTLFEACNLLSLADAMEAQLAVDGLMIDGSRSRVANPLIAEIRHARIGAMNGLRALGIAPGQTPASAAGSALAMKRHHGRTPGRRNG